MTSTANANGPMRRNIGWLIPGALALATIAPIAGQGAITIDFTEIANTGVPGIFSLYVRPSISGNTVAFGASATGGDAVFTGDGSTLSLVAGASTPIPDGTGNFTSLSIPSISGSTVAMRGTGSGSQVGAYRYVGTTGTTIANEGTTIPSGSGSFTAISAGNNDGSTVAFRGQGSSLQDGIYTGTGAGSPTLIADRNTSVPGGVSTFEQFSTPAISGSTVAFMGRDGILDYGIYTYVGASGTLIANESTAIPSGTGNFGLFSGPLSVSGSTVAFRGLGSGQEGFYTGNGVSVDLVADLNTAIPEGTGTFNDFDPYASISGTSVAFLGNGTSGQEGIYVLVNGNLEKVVDLNDTIDGKTPTSFSFGVNGLDDNSLAFSATFSGADPAVYRADFSLSGSSVPEPTTVTLIGVAGLTLGALRRRHGRTPLIKSQEPSSSYRDAHLFRCSRQRMQGPRSHRLTGKRFFCG